MIVTKSGAKGANGAHGGIGAAGTGGAGGPGGAADAAASSAVDLTNSATAYGGWGGAGGDGGAGWFMVVSGVKYYHSGSIGGAGGPGASANASATSTAAGATGATARAVGGKGGAGGSGGNGYEVSGAYLSDGGAGGAAGVGGNANATAVITSSTLAATTAQATALGGGRGAGGAGGLGKVGGLAGADATGGGATAAASDNNAGGASSAVAAATGGGGGGGGAAAATASAVSTAPGAAATARATQTAGSGFSAIGGTSSTMTNAVTGSTDGGKLTLYQSAAAGGEISMNAAGAGGDADSSLTFDDTKNATQSAVVEGTVVARGGAGGAGGGADAALFLTGAKIVTGSATAWGGAETNYGASTTVVVQVKGAAAHAWAVAHGTGGATAAGTASAIANSRGASGTFNASADTALAPGQLVQAISADASGAFKGASEDVSSTGVATADIDAGLIDNDVADEGVAVVTGAPNATAASDVFAANSNIAGLFGPSPTVFAIGELGGGHSAAATGVQTTTATMVETVDLTKLASPGELLAGLFWGSAKGLSSDVTNVTFKLFVDGVRVESRGFSNALAAETYFTDHAIDIGSLASGALSGATLTLKAVLTETSIAAGSGFYGDIILGDPPGAKTSAAHQGFIAAAAGLVAGGSGSTVPGRRILPDVPSLLAAAGQHVQIA